MAQRWLSGISKCSFCNKTIPADTPYRYVYPIPKPHPSHNFDGAKCCLDCWPDIHAAQVDQGLVEDVIAGEAHVHAGA